MPIRTLLLSTVMLSAPLAPLRAAVPATTQASRTVGSVYGKGVTAEDVRLTVRIDPAAEFDARDTAEWEQMGRIMTTFGKPILDRFVEKGQIGATAEEIAAFRKNARKGDERQLRGAEDRLKKLEAELASAKLSEAAKAKLEKERASLERSMPARRDAAVEADSPESVARMFIIAWKVERELHRAYGGRVIFQQFGPEALDARRLLFEEAEKNGDLKFNDPAVRRLFYYYANMKHLVVDAKVLETPWFLEDPID